MSEEKEPDSQPELLRADSDQSDGGWGAAAADDWEAKEPVDGEPPEEPKVLRAESDGGWGAAGADDWGAEEDPVDGGAWDEEEAEAAEPEMFQVQKQMEDLRRRRDLIAKGIEVDDYDSGTLTTVYLHIDPLSVLTPLFAKAWKVHAHLPITLELLCKQEILSSADPPRVRVYQKEEGGKKLEFPLDSTLQALAAKFLQELWDRKEATDARMLELEIDLDEDFDHPAWLPPPPPSSKGTKGVAPTPSATASSSTAAEPKKKGFWNPFGFGKKKEAKATPQTAPATPAAAAASASPTGKGGRSALERLVKGDKAGPVMTAKDEAMAASCRWGIGGVFSRLCEYLVLRLPTLNEYCVMCDKPHNTRVAMLKPAVCSDPLCTFQFHILGLKKNLAEGVAPETELVDLLVAMAVAAVKWDLGRPKFSVFEPYPTLYLANQEKPAMSPAKKDFKEVMKILKAIPDTGTMLACTKKQKGADRLQRIFANAHPLAQGMMQWLIDSNRSMVVPLPETYHFKSLGTPHQYIMISSPPAKEKRFNKLKATHGTVFAFHGSPRQNWHSIFRNGLKNYSGTAKMANGKVHGSGIYMAPAASHGLQYSKIATTARAPTGTQLNKNAFLNAESLAMLALLEVVDGPQLNKAPGWCWVCSNEDYIVTRFFFVFSNNTAASTAAQVQTVTASFKKEIELGMKGLSLFGHV